jgi:hypothetical protein
MAPRSLAFYTNNLRRCGLDCTGSEYYSIAHGMEAEHSGRAA